jgi:two-component system, OmpR family, sensor histidine kinase KdpD
MRSALVRTHFYELLTTFARPDPESRGKSRRSLMDFLSGWKNNDSNTPRIYAIFMNGRLRCFSVQMLIGRSAWRLLKIAAAALLVAGVTWIAFCLHAEAFIAGFLYLLVLVPIAFQWGFLEATVASILAVSCLDYFFTQPLFSMYMSDAQDWVALAAFESVVLVVSRLAQKLRGQAVEMAAREECVDRLYAMSRELLLFDRREPVGTQLTRLIIQIFGVRTALVWNPLEARAEGAGSDDTAAKELRSVYLNGNSVDDPEQGRFARPLFMREHRLGALLVAADAGKLDVRTVDAIASLAAIALEREHLFLAESHAEALRQSEQLRSTVMDGLAHAYKTPLATIQAASSGLLEINRMDDVERELVRDIYREAEHLAALTNQSLSTACLEADCVKPRPENIALESFLRTDWSLFAEGMKDHDLEIQTGAPGQSVWADPRLLQMALVQLLDNASKYAAPGSPISVRIAVTDDETVLGVHNFGSYISPEEKMQIFKRCYRSPQWRLRAPGTGIGLTVSKQIAEAHRGRVWVESDREQGTTFFLSLPHVAQEDK